MCCCPGCSARPRLPLREEVTGALTGAFGAPGTEPDDLCGISGHYLTAAVSDATHGAMALIRIPSNPEPYALCL
jgi:hypothetical protein